MFNPNVGYLKRVDYELVEYDSENAGNGNAVDWPDDGEPHAGFDDAAVHDGIPDSVKLFAISRSEPRA